MKLVGIAAAIVIAFVARVDASGDKALARYAGRIVISPDPPPASSEELPGFLKANATADNRYEVLEGPPWRYHLVAVLAKDPGDKPVFLVFSEVGSKKRVILTTVEVRAQKRIVIATSEATIAAGFAAGKTYSVRLEQGKTVLARATLHLRY